MTGVRDRVHRRLLRLSRHAAVVLAVVCAVTFADGARAPMPVPSTAASTAIPAASPAVHSPASRDAVARESVGSREAQEAAPEAAWLAPSDRGVEPARSYPDAGEIQLANGVRFDPLAGGDRGRVAAPATVTSGSSDRSAWLVQFTGPIQAGQREQLEAAGALVVAYVPRYAFLVRMNEAVRSGVAGLSFVRWVGAYQASDKISAELSAATAGSAATMVVLLFPDAHLAAERAALEAMGGTIVEATDSGRNKIVRVTLDASQAATIAARNDVAWVELYHQPKFENSTAQWVVQTNVTNNRRIWDMGLHGEGQVVHTSDSGIRTTHNAFRDPAVPITTFGDYPTHRKIIAYRAALPGIVFGDASGASYHGTHTAGTIVGDDSPFATDARDGQALKAKIFFTDAGNTTNSISAPGDLNLLFGPAYAGNAGGAPRISSNSWGASSNNYDVQAMTVDQFMWDHKDFAIFFSNGNDFAAAQVGTPAVSKNTVGVGATQNGAASGVKASFSSEGPTEDGRRKPTVCAPGDGVTPLSGIASANGANDTGYQNLSGTSMASPAAAGGAALVRQYLTQGWYPTGAPVAANAIPDPSAALIKAMVMTSTDDDMPGHPLPDFAVGWGRMKLDNVLYFPGDALHTALVDDTAGLTTGQYVEYPIQVTNTAVPLKLTLCWTDREGNPASLTQLVNDLDLRVTDPNGVAYLGNVLTNGQSVPGGSADILNVEEGVRVNVPIAGTWKVRVSATNVPYGPQPFALAITGGVGGASGFVTLDRRVYGRDDQVHVRVEDVGAVGPITVNVSSNTESTPEVLTLSGTGGVFTGTIATTPAEPTGDGALSVSHGDSITVAYADASPAMTVQATAVVSFDGPVIRDVLATERGETQSITWTTNVSATARVYYGTTGALGQVSTLDPELTLSHARLLTDLQPETEYFYDVESTDQGGNTTRDDNGGLHYRFVSGRRGDILVVIGDGSFPMTSSYVDALIERGWNPAVLEGGTIESPLVGDRTNGLRSFTAVWWQVGQEQYPPVPDAARDSLDLLLAGGGRLAVTGHDVAWAFTDPASGFYTPQRVAWLENTLHARFLEDPVVWPANQGIAGDPISDAYQAGAPYVPHRPQGGSGDEIELVNGSGTGAYVWKNTDATQGNIGLRWQSGIANGDPAKAVWGGTPSKVLYNAFEWVQLAQAADRTDILDRSLVWLIGNDHPDVAVTSPNGGEVVTGNTVSVAWTETPHGAASIVNRAVYVSSDGGASWQLVTANAGASPYGMDVSGRINGGTYRVRVDVTDNGSPGLHGHDASNADFAIQRTGGDTRGPVLVAGTIRTNPNPVDNRESCTLTARLSDADDGGSAIAAAEWSQGASPAVAGSGTPMSGSFDSTEVAVSVTIPHHKLPPGEPKIWVRGRDAAGNWGPASSRAVAVNGDPLAAEGPSASRFALEQNAPNPIAGGRTMIRYALPRAGRVELAIYGVRGEKVRTLVSEFQAPGSRTVSWDRRDASGRRVPSGMYFYRLEVGKDRAERKMVVLD